MDIVPSANTTVRSVSAFLLHFPNHPICFNFSVLCVACGFVLTKADNFPAIAARGAGQIMLNIALPCLMFSKIVPAFTADNIAALGKFTFLNTSSQNSHVVLRPFGVGCYAL